MNAHEWDLILMEVEVEFAEIIAEFEREWMGNRAELMEALDGLQAEQVHGQTERELS